MEGLIEVTYKTGELEDISIKILSGAAERINIPAFYCYQGVHINICLPLV
jgi:hypothetical protein